MYLFDSVVSCSLLLLSLATLLWMYLFGSVVSCSLLLLSLATLLWMQLFGSQCLSQELKKVRHMSRPAEKGETYVSPS